MTTPAYDQDSYRIRRDDGSESAAGWSDNLNKSSAQSWPGLGTTFRVRFLVQEYNDKAENNVGFKLQASMNGAAYADVTTTSSNVKAVDSTYLTDNEDTTQQLGSGTYIADNNGVCEDGVTDGTVDFAGLDEAEFEFSLQLVEADWDEVGDYCDLQMTLADGTLLNVYTNTPRLRRPVLTSIGPGTSHNAAVDITSVSGSGPWTVTLGSGEGTNADVGDALWDEKATPDKYLITAISGDDLTVEDKDGNGAAPSTTGGSTAYIKRYYEGSTPATDWEAGTADSNLYASGNDAKGELWNDSDTALDESLTINDSSIGLNDIWLTVADGEQHDGTAGSGVRIVASTGRRVVVSVPGAIHLLEIDNNSQSIVGYALENAGYLEYISFQRTLVHGVAGASQVDRGGIGIIGGDGTGDICNNFVWDIVSTGAGADDCTGIGVGISSRAITIASNSVCGVTNDSSSGSTYAIKYVDSSNATIADNVACDASGGGTTADYNITSPSNATVQTNASSDASAPDPITGNPVSSAVEFVSTSNLHLASGSAECVDAGTDLGTTPPGVELAMPVGSYTNGYDRNADPEGVSPSDVGAAEYLPIAETASLIVAQLGVQAAAVTATYVQEESAMLSEAAPAVQAPSVTAQYVQEESATLAAGQLAVQAPTVTAQHVQEESVALAVAQLAVEALAVTATYQSELSASLSEAALSVQAPAVTPTYQAELTASLAEAVLTVEAPPVTASAGNEQTATLSVAQLAVEGLAVTPTYVQQESASLAEAQLTVEAPAVTASSGNEQTATLSEGVLAVQAAPVTAQYVQAESATLTAAELATQAPGVTAQYELLLTATLAQAVLSLEAPGVTADYQADLTASLAAAELTVGAASISAGYIQTESASLAAAILTVQGPAVTAQYLVTTFAFYVVAGRTFTNGAVAGKACVVGVAAGRVFVPGANIGAVAA